MAVFEIIPNRGARFGHQFFELSCVRALAIKYGGKLNLPNAFEANAKNFSTIFNPSDSNLSTEGFSVLDLLDFSIQEDFSAYLLENTVDISSSDLLIKGCFQKVPWISKWIRSELSSYELAVGLEYTAAQLKLSVLNITQAGSWGKKSLAVHVRRGDVSPSKNSSRYVGSEYYIDVLKQVFSLLPVKPSDVYVYSTPDFCIEDFSQFHGLNYRINLSEVDAFLELASHPILIGSPSGFSYTAHLVASSVVLVHPADWNPYYRRDATRSISDFVVAVNNIFSE